MTAIRRPGGHRRQVGLEAGAAHQLDDHVVGAVGPRLRRIHELRAQFRHRRAEGGLSDAGHHPGAERDPDLHRRRAHPTGRAGHQQALSTLELALRDQGVVGGDEDLRESAGVGPSERGRHRHGHALVDDRHLGLRAPPTNDITRSPRWNRVVPSPRPTTSPASSSPGMSAGSPGVGVQPAEPASCRRRSARRPAPGPAPLPARARGRDGPRPRTWPSATTTARRAKVYLIHAVAARAGADRHQRRPMGFDPDDHQASAIRSASSGRSARHRELHRGALVGLLGRQVLAGRRA